MTGSSPSTSGSSHESALVQVPVPVVNLSQTGHRRDLALQKVREQPSPPNRSHSLAECCRVLQIWRHIDGVRSVEEIAHADAADVDVELVCTCVRHLAYANSRTSQRWLLPL